MLVSETTPWKLTCPQTLVCLWLHSSVFVFALLAIYFASLRDTWLPVQHTYQIALLSFGYGNIGMQWIFVLLVCILDQFQKRSANNDHIENSRIAIVIQTFTWISANISMLVIFPIFFAHEAIIGQRSIMDFSIVLLSYMIFLLVAFCVVIYVYVWPTCQ